MITTEPLQVRTAATAVCIRRTSASAEPLIRGELPRLWKEAEALVFGEAESVAFTSGWELLLGQAEVQNWLRSSPDKAVPMRYPGEWKFAGGSVDPGEMPKQAARRELEEQFNLKLPQESCKCKLRLFSIKQTRPIRNVSYIMYNYVAAAEENAWLHDFDPASANEALSRRRVEREAAAQSGAFWELDKGQKELLSPEVREVCWLDVRSAVLGLASSMQDVFVPVNAFQALEFERLGIRKRDPMRVTILTILELESFPSLESLVRYTEHSDPMAQLQQAQWLVEGMSPEEVAAAWASLATTNQGIIRSAKQLSLLRHLRR